MHRALRLGLPLLLALLLFTVAGYFALLRLEVLPRLAFAPGYSLTDQEGRRLTSEDLRGKVVVYTFTYGGCTDARLCTLPVLRQVHERFTADDTAGVPVRLVAVSIDPERDTPEALRRLAGNAPHRLLLASADTATVRRIAGQGFGVWYARQADGSFRFDPVFVVVDGWGIVRARYRYGLPDADALVRDVRSVVREARAATGPLRYAYEAAHLFNCYGTS